MKRYFTRNLIFPDGSELPLAVLETEEGRLLTYRPFEGEEHSTSYLKERVWLSAAPDREGQTFRTIPIEHTMKQSDREVPLYAYRLLTSADGLLTATKL